MVSDSHRNKIIGGTFGLPELRETGRPTPAFLREGDLLPVNARSGIRLLVEQLAPRRVWMPSYLCRAMLAGLPEIPIEFYEIGPRLRPTSLVWVPGVQPGDLVVLIDYFGWPSCPTLANLLRERGAWVLEDACQAMLTEGIGRAADFLLMSPRKFVGVPDGGILRSNREEIDLSEIPLQPPPGEWWLKAFSAFAERGEFDRHGGSRAWFERRREADAGNPVGPYRMSDLSAALLAHGFDYREIARRRITNYRLLAERLGDLALFPDLPGGIVPIGFPIRLPERDQVRKALFRHGIYPPVHWPIEDAVPGRFEESHALAREIMTLPCDQRYDESDMARMAEIVRKEAWR